jgi:hypothetical protein
MKRPLSFSLSLSLSVLPVVLFATLAFAQGDEVAPNENLVVEGIPRIPAALAESVGRYGRVPLRRQRRVL